MATLRKRKAKDGLNLWSARYMQNGFEREISFGKINKDIAKRNLLKIEVALNEGSDPRLLFHRNKQASSRNESMITLAEAFQKFNEHKARGNRNTHSTIVSRRRALGTIPNQTKRKLIRDVTLTDIEKWWETYAQTRSRATANMALRYLRSVFNWCIKIGLLEKSPMIGLTESPEVENHKHKALNKEQVDLILAESKKMSWKFYRGLFIALNFGLRAGEIISLTWADVFNEGETITVLGRETKTHKTRYVPSPSKKVIDEILSWRNGDKDTDQVVKLNSGWVFSSLFRKLANENGWSKDLTFHSTRHTYVSNLLTQNVSPSIISRLVGHSSVTVTDKYYSHFNNNDLQEGASKLSYKC